MEVIQNVLLNAKNLAQQGSLFSKLSSRVRKIKY